MVDTVSFGTVGFWALDDWGLARPVTVSTYDRDKMALLRRPRNLARTQVGPFEVSTVLLSHDHGFGGEPVVFETMVFVNGLEEEDCWRSRHTWEALRWHDYAVSVYATTHDKGPKAVPQRTSWHRAVALAAVPPRVEEEDVAKSKISRKRERAVKRLKQDVAELWVADGVYQAPVYSCYNADCLGREWGYASEWVSWQHQLAYAARGLGLYYHTGEDEKPGLLVEPAVCHLCGEVNLGDPGSPFGDLLHPSLRRVVDLYGNAPLPREVAHNPGPQLRNLYDPEVYGRLGALVASKDILPSVWELMARNTGQDVEAIFRELRAMRAK